MEDSENKSESITTQSEPKKAEKTAKDNKKKNSFFKSLKAEFNRIIWPDRDTVVKETTAVVVVTVILGAVIALLDFALKLGIDKIIQIG